MPRPPRINYEGAFYHVYNRGVEKRAIVCDDQDRKTFIQFLGAMVLKFKLQLFSYCLMENHYHFFLQTSLPNLSQAMWDLGRQYATYFNQKYFRVGPLFQGRYQARLVSQDTDAIPLIRYIHLNPVEAGIADRAEDYTWSSYPAYMGKVPSWKWLECNWVLKLFHSEPAAARQMFEFFHLRPSPLAIAPVPGPF